MRLLTRAATLIAATLILAAGGVLVIPASPASAHCSTGHFKHPDRYNNGGIFFERNGTPLREKPHAECEIVLVVSGIRPSVNCAKEIPTSQNDWVFMNGFWARENQLNTDGRRMVPGCVDPDHRVEIWPLP